jgi:hypothetical protein
MCVRVEVGRISIESRNNCKFTVDSGKKDRPTRWQSERETARHDQGAANERISVCVTWIEQWGQAKPMKVFNQVFTKMA